MTHTAPMADNEGSFDKSQPTETPCPKCRGPVTVCCWESSCGGYVDHKYSCQDPACGHSWWVEGPDA